MGEDVVISIGGKQIGLLVNGGLTRYGQAFFQGFRQGATDALRMLSEREDANEATRLKQVREFAKASVRDQLGGRDPRPAASETLASLGRQGMVFTAARHQDRLLALSIARHNWFKHNQLASELRRYSMSASA